eukprot:1368142-Pleurochrysis_carterae.AAC.4
MPLTVRYSQRALPTPQSQGSTSPRASKSNPKSAKCTCPHPRAAAQRSCASRTTRENGKCADSFSRLVLESMSAVRANEAARRIPFARTLVLESVRMRANKSKATIPRAQDHRRRQNA